MITSDNLYKFIKKKSSVSGTEIADHFGITRQAANKHVKSLLKEGKIFKEGVTRAARYKPSESSGEVSAPRVSKKTYLIEGLEEHTVFRSLSAMLNLEQSMSSSAFAIVRHAFTEMLNNAIDHSGSERCLVKVELNQYECMFTIRDYGIGLFHSIRERFSLEDEHAALGLLLKGKTTTMEERHSGEGIFFTSKSGDRMILRSHRIRLSFDNVKDAVVAEESRLFQGTEVSFVISRRSRRDLSSIFSTYSPEEYDYRFEKTRVLVSLSPQEHISRSEARRLLFGLDKFSEIILDFKKVKAIGQGFADEIFRVFKGEHPEISITVDHASKVIQEMVSHVQVDN